MAIVKVTAPSSVPTTVADYQAQNAHLMAFMNQVNLQAFILTDPLTLDKPKIAMGAYISHGGNLYKVTDENYEISGSPSDGLVYVRVSGDATLTAEFIDDISSYAYNAAYGAITSGSYTLLPYEILKDGSDWKKYRYTFIGRTDQDLRMRDDVLFNKLSIADRGVNIGGVYYKPSISSMIKRVFSSPATGPSGLTFDGTNLISCDSGEAKIYIHNGISSSILTSFSSPATNPIGLTFDGTNLISCDLGAAKIYIHNGISSSILTSFSSPATNPSGLTFDGTNLISCDLGEDKIYIHNGISSSILTSFSSPGTGPRGLTFDGTNLISCDLGADKIYIHTTLVSA